MYAYACMYVCKRMYVWMQYGCIHICQNLMTTMIHPNAHNHNVLILNSQIFEMWRKLMVRPCAPFPLLLTSRKLHLLFANGYSVHTDVCFPQLAGAIILVPPEGGKQIGFAFMISTIWYSTRTHANTYAHVYKARRSNQRRSEKTVSRLGERIEKVTASQRSC